MTKRNRIFIGILLIYAAGIAFILSGALSLSLPYGAQTVRHVWMTIGIVMLAFILVLFALRPKNGRA